MKGKIYPILNVAVLMSFIITYGISEGEFKINAFPKIFAEEKAETEQIRETEQAKAAEQTKSTEEKKEIVSKVKEPSLKEKYDIERSNEEHKITLAYINDQYTDYDEVVQKESDGVKESVYDEMTTSRGAFRFSNEMDMVATAYDLSYESCGKYPDDPYYGITASGAKAQPGTVAVDPSVIPLGTKLYIASTDGSPDYGFATALDTGSAIKGYKIDLFMEDNQDAIDFGIRQVKVYILE